MVWLQLRPSSSLKVILVNLKLFFSASAFFLYTVPLLEQLEERRSSSEKAAAAFFFISFPTLRLRLRRLSACAAANFLFCKWENIVYITAKSKSRCGSCCYPWAGARRAPSSSLRGGAGIRPPLGPPSSSRHWVDPVKRGRVFVARIVAKRDWI